MSRLMSYIFVEGGLMAFPWIGSAIKGTRGVVLASSVCVLLRPEGALPTSIPSRTWFVGFWFVGCLLLHARLHLVYLLLVIGVGISFPVAMLRATEEDEPFREQNPVVSHSSSDETMGADDNRVDSDLEPHFDWCEPVNGLRAAVRIRNIDSPGILGRERKILLLLQNVSDKPIRFCDSGMSGGDALKEGVDKRTLYLRNNNEVLSGLSSAESLQTDITLKPREMVELDLFRNEEANERRPKVADVIAEGIIKYPKYDVYATLTLNKAPEGAWTGKLTTPPTRGAFAAAGHLPKDKHGQVLFRYCLDQARFSGDIPGGLIERLEDMVREFIFNNTGDQYGDSYATKMEPLLARFERQGDWGQADVVALLDDIAAVTTIPLERTMEKIRENTLQRGQPLPASLNDANWGAVLPGGLRMAWRLEPREEKYRLGSSLRSRVLIHNAGNEPVIFVTRSFHQPVHNATLASGATVSVDSTYWTTLGRPEPYRLHPGEYCEVHAPGIGVGARNDEVDDWSNIRAGSWILANKDDDIIFQPGPIMLSGDNNQQVDPDWWLQFITERIQRDAPLPDDAKEREVILFRVISDLFGNSPTPDEAAALLADKSPQAVNNLAKLLSTRSWHKSVEGPISSGLIKFQVLPVDPDAATRPRVVTDPGHYKLGDEMRFVITRRPVGQRLVNEASIVWYPPGKESVPTKVPLPENYESWAAAWAPNSTVLWVRERGLLRSYDFTQSDDVKETRFAEDQIAAAPIPADVRMALQSAFVEVNGSLANPNPNANPPAASPSANANNGPLKKP